jgi:hypothetical protein
MDLHHIREDFTMSSNKQTPDQESQETSAAVAEAPAGEAKPSFAERVGRRKRPLAPDPFGIATDNVAGVRLFESKRDRQMAIKFDDKPSQAVIDRLKEAGYRWNSADKIWAHPVGADSAMSDRIEAERLYQEVRGMVRGEKGIADGTEVPF